jgi:hypothetical protein
MLLMLEKSDSSSQAFMGEIYFYEYSIKSPGQAYIGFVITDSASIIQDIRFKVFFSKGKIENITINSERIGYPRTFTKKVDGNIFIEAIQLLCYSDVNFNKRKRLIEDEFYTMISDKFLVLSNQERLKLLEELSK